MRGAIVVSAQANQAAVVRLANEVLNQHDLTALDDIFHADYIKAEPPPGMGPGLEGLWQWLALWFEAFPDARWTVEEQIVDGDQVWSRSTWRGTHRGIFLGVPETGREATVAAWTIDRFTDGKIAHSRIIMNSLD